jgi:hypothetical protein
MVSWFVTLCSVFYGYQLFGGTYSLYPDDGRKTFLWNVREDV